MTEALRKLSSLLDARERKRGFLVFLLLLVVAFVEVLGVASVVPFIAVLSNPEVIDNNPYLAWFYTTLGFDSKSSFLYFLGLAFFFILATSLTFKALGLWAQLRFSHNRNFAWSTRLVGAYLRQPYEWFLNRHSANLATSVLAEVNQVINRALLPAMQAIAQSLVAVFLLGLLFAADPLLALLVGGALGGGYVLIASLLRRRLSRIGTMQRAANRWRFHIIRAFGAHWRRLTEEPLGCADEIDVFRVTYEQLLSDHDKLASLSSYLGYELEAVGGTRRVGSSTHRKGVRNPRYGLNLIDSMQIAGQVGDMAERLDYAPSGSSRS